MRRLNFLLTLLLVIVLDKGLAQGCSDAGFCTFGNLKHQESDSIRGSKIQMSFPFGLGDEEVRIFAPSLQFDHQFSSRWAIQTKVTWNHANGNLAAVSGPGDLYLAGIYAAPLPAYWKISAMLGAKAPLNNSSLGKDGMDLPMVYQSSLGTVDLITGVSFLNRNWVVSFGCQQPISGANGNHFLPDYWDSPEAAAYPASNEIVRKGDVLMRVSYAREFGTRWLLQGGVLNIYHLGEDTYTRPQSTGRIAIKGSRGLTMNVTGSAWANISPSFKVGITAGIPFVVRDIRPDGLTRSFVVSPEVQWKL